MNEVEQPDPRSRDPSEGSRIVDPHDERGARHGSATSAGKGRLPRWLTLSVLAMVAPLCGIAAYAAARSSETRDLVASFREFATERNGEIERELARCLEALHHLRAFFDSSEIVTESEFSSFTKGTVARRASIQALEWAPRVTDEDRPRHEHLAREAGFEDYVITAVDANGQPMSASATGRAYFPVKFAEPLAGNRGAVGFDLASDETRRIALLRAAALGSAVMTAPIELVQDSGDAPSTIAFLAVRDEVASSPGYLESGLRGVVLMVIRYRDLVECALGANLQSANASMRFQVVDVDGDGYSRVVFDNSAVSGRPANGNIEPLRDEFRTGERRLAMIATPTERFLADRRGREPFWLAIITTLVSGFAVTMLYVQARRARTRATRQLDSLVRSVLTSLSEGVVVADRNGHVRFANDVAIRALGPIAHSSPLDWPTVCGIFLEDTSTPCPVDQMPLVRAIRGERVASQHMFVRNESVPDGRWFGISASPLLDESHVLQGGVAVLRDITQRKRTHGELIRLSAAVELTTDAVMITDRDGRIVYVNRAFETSTGYSADMAIGRTPRILKSGVHEPSVYSAIWSTLLAGKVYRGALTNRRVDGTLFATEQTITPIRDDFDGSVYFVAVAKQPADGASRDEQTSEWQLAAETGGRPEPNGALRIPRPDVASASFSLGLVESREPESGASPD